MNKRNGTGRRKLIRLKRYDYSSAGYYFVTVCTQNRKFLFGEIIDGEMKLNQMGKIVQEEWIKTEQIQKNVKLDLFVIMPNHFHGIISISDRRGTARRAPTKERFGHPIPGSLPTIIRSFKSAITNQVHKIFGSEIIVWQRNYYEHVIRNEKELFETRQYIENNSKQWELDPENPEFNGRPNYKSSINFIQS